MVRDPRAATGARPSRIAEALLRAVLGGDDSHELFGWLRTLTFVEEADEGLYPHDVARDALTATCAGGIPRATLTCTAASGPI